MSGKITLDGGGTDSGIWVEVVRPDGSSVHGDDTNALGNYSIGGIAPGTYTLSFDDDESDSYFPFQYLGGTIVVGDATTFTVGAEGTTTVVDGAIRPGAGSAAPPSAVTSPVPAVSRSTRSTSSRGTRKAASGPRPAAP